MPKMPSLFAYSLSLANVSQVVLNVILPAVSASPRAVAKAAETQVPIYAQTYIFLLVSPSVPQDDKKNQSSCAFIILSIYQKSPFLRTAAHL
jgi:hypothetical protein